MSILNSIHNLFSFNREGKEPLELAQNQQKGNGLVQATESSLKEGKEQLELAQSQQKGDGLAKATESSLRHIEDSKEEALERSWDFLTYITEKVSTLPPELQDRILELGKKLSEAGTSYNHMVPNPHRRKESPAKVAALSAGSGGSYDSIHS